MGIDQVNFFEGVERAATDDVDDFQEGEGLQDMGKVALLSARSLCQKAYLAVVASEDGDDVAGVGVIGGFQDNGFCSAEDQRSAPWCCERSDGSAARFLRALPPPQPRRPPQLD